jgi:tripartite-type tricarboxylate transporter receptor subunit TctC
MIRRRHLLVGAAALAVPPAARAGQNLALLVGARAGSGPDEVARAFAPFLARHLRFTEIEIRNIQGSAGLAAARALADASPAGDVLGWVATPTLSARMVDRAADDLMQHVVLLGAVQKEPIVFVSPSATPLGSVQDIIERSADDAGAVPLGTPPPGSPPHLAALRLQAIAGARLNIMAFPSAEAARQAAVAGNVAAAALSLSSAIGELREGRLAGLGIAAKNRADVFPDMPPLRDSGLELSAVIYRGLAVPAGFPQERADRLRGAMRDVVADPEFRAQAHASGFIVTWIDGSAWTAMVEAERAELARLWATEPWLQEGTG